MCVAFGFKVVAHGGGDGSFECNDVVNAGDGKILSFVDTADERSPVGHVGESAEGFGNTFGVVVAGFLDFDEGRFGFVRAEFFEDVFESVVCPCHVYIMAR